MIIIGLLPKEAAAVLSALAKTNDSEETSKEDVMHNSSVAERILRVRDENMADLQNYDLIEKTVAEQKRQQGV
jgi:hypothetical protein